MTLTRRTEPNEVGPTIRVTQSDPNGNFVFAGVRPGVYKLETRRFGYARFVVYMILEDGTDTTLTIHLDAGSRFARHDERRGQERDRGFVQLSLSPRRFLRATTSRSRSILHASRDRCNRAVVTGNAAEARCRREGEHDAGRRAQSDLRTMRGDHATVAVARERD